MLKSGNRMNTITKFGHWFIMAMGIACLLMLITGISSAKVFVGVDIAMIAIWLWDEYSHWKHKQ